MEQQQRCIPHPHTGDIYRPLFGVNALDRALIAAAVQLLAAVYCWAIVRAARPGLPRLLFCLPAMAAIHGVPLLFDPIHEPLATMSATFIAVRLTSGKVVAFIMGRGVLVLPLSLAQFVAVMLAPFMPAQLVASKLPALYTAPQDSAEAAAGKRAAGQQKKPVASEMAENSQGTAPARHLPQVITGTTWQQVTPVQRYSLDSVRHSMDSIRHSMDGSSSTNSPTKLGLTSGRSTAAAAFSNLRNNGENGQSSITYFESSASADDKTAQRLRHIANVLLNCSVATAFLIYSCGTKQRLAAFTVHITGMVIMWRAMEVLMRSVSTPARDFLGMTLAPHFRNPFASSSLTDFWARRWNITQGLVLRFFVYEPIVEGRLVAKEPLTSASADTQPTLDGASSTGKTAEAATTVDADINDIAKPASKLGNVWYKGLRRRAGSNATAGLHGLFADAQCTIDPQPASASKPPKAPGINNSVSCSSGSSSSTCSDVNSNILASASPPDYVSADHEVGPKQQQQHDCAAAARKRASVPVLAGPSAAVAPKWRRQVAAAATFVVSGLEHELFMWYCTRRVGWQWLVFFSLQGLILAAETVVRRRCRALGLQLHPWVTVMGLLLVLGVTADAFFWPVLVQPALVHPLLAAMPQQLLQLIGAPNWCTA